MPAFEIAVAEAMYLDGQCTSAEDLGLSNCARTEIFYLQAQLSQSLIELLPSGLSVE
jgi:hypothetical protein